MKNIISILNNQYYIIGVILFTLLVLIIFYPKKRKKQNSHKRRIKTGDRVLKKLNAFEYNGAKINYLKKIDPFVFEELILSAFENDGYRIKRNKRYTGDGGIDGIVYDSENKSYLIQCKRYYAHVKKQDIIEFQKLIVEMDFYGGYFCHTGKTGKYSLTNFKNSNVEIISGDKLITLITKKSTSEQG